MYLTFRMQGDYHSLAGWQIIPMVWVDVCLCVSVASKCFHRYSRRGIEMMEAWGLSRQECQAFSNLIIQFREIHSAKIFRLVHVSGFIWCHVQNNQPNETLTRALTVGPAEHAKGKMAKIKWKKNKKIYIEEKMKGKQRASMQNYKYDGQIDITKRAS